MRSNNPQFIQEILPILGSNFKNKHEPTSNETLEIENTPDEAAKTRSEPKGKRSRPSTSKKQGRFLGLDLETTVTVIGLPQYILEKQLIALFSNAGTVKNVSIKISDAFESAAADVEMSSHEEAEKAVRMFNGMEYSYKKILAHIKLHKIPGLGGTK